MISEFRNLWRAEIYEEGILGSSGCVWDAAFCHEEERWREELLNPLGVSVGERRLLICGLWFDSHPAHQASLAYGELRLGKPASLLKAKAVTPKRSREGEPLHPINSRKPLIRLA